MEKRVRTDIMDVDAMSVRALIQRSVEGGKIGRRLLLLILLLLPPRASSAFDLSQWCNLSTSPFVVYHKPTLRVDFI